MTTKRVLKYLVAEIAFQRSMQSHGAHKDALFSSAGYLQLLEQLTTVGNVTRQDFEGDSLSPATPHAELSMHMRDTLMLSSYCCSTS